MTKWIAMADKKPEIGSAVLVYVPRDLYSRPLIMVVEVSKPWVDGEEFDFTSHGWGGYEWELDFQDHEVTHWAELPEPPK